MNSIESSTRSNFFTNSKQAAAKRSAHLKGAALNRNSPTRQNELQSITKGDSKVQISDAIKDFARIKKVVDAAPQIDNSAKMAKLKAQIQNGTYNVDYNAVADKILATEF